MKRLLLVVACLFLLISGCEKKKEAPETTIEALPVQAPAPPLPRSALLREPIEATLVEYPTEALPVWRKFRAAKPVLVLLSRDPFLQSIPTGILEQARDLVLQGTPEAMTRRGAQPSADPILLPPMAVRAALQAGLFSRIAWVMPSQADREDLDLEIFRRQLMDFGAVNEQEAQTFTRGDGLFSGYILNTPLDALLPAALTAPTEPAILHIDLSFFAPFYKGEVKTPLYSLLYQTLNTLKEKGLQVLAVTLSSSNASGDLPLDARFIGPTLTELFQKPELLTQPLPEPWALRANALYLPNFMKTEETREIYHNLEARLPGDPSIRFGLYQVHRQLKRGTEALAYLKQAVELDPVYGLEYLLLATTALEKGSPDDAVRMQTLAAATFSDNPFVRLQLAQLLLKLKRDQEANDILSELRLLEWSPLYYPRVPTLLEELAASAAPPTSAK